ncbi:MAG: glutathione S-transferase family protein [Pseudomonadota bacterium]
MPEIEPDDISLKSLNGLHLWHAPMSSCSQRVRIVLSETGKAYESHLINLEKDEHASAEYQAIHPKGLVPALVHDGRLYIESIDIIRHLADGLDDGGSPELLEQVDNAQLDLKLLTFEFLFRSKAPPPSEAAEKFQQNHHNDWLRRFRRDFAQGFDPQRVNDAIARTDAGFQELDNRLSDGRPYLAGNAFSLCDVAWMPNVHRFRLMDWPFERTRHLQAWFEQISQRPSYREGLLEWQGDGVAEAFAAYTKQRRSAGNDVRSYPHFAG